MRVVHILFAGVCTALLRDFHLCAQVGDLILGGELLEGIGAVFTGSSEVAGGSQVAEFFQPLTNLIEEISNSISSLF